MWQVPTSSTPQKLRDRLAVRFTRVSNGRNTSKPMKSHSLDSLLVTSMPSRNAPFKTRLMAANAVFISVLSYLITLWGAGEGYLLRALQVVQNKADRCVTKVSWFTATRQLLKQCGWMSIKQLVFYHTALTMHKTIMSGKPVYTRHKLSHDYPYT